MLALGYFAVHMCHMTMWHTDDTCHHFSRVKSSSINLIVTKVWVKVTVASKLRKYNGLWDDGILLQTACSTFLLCVMFPVKRRADQYNESTLSSCRVGCCFRRSHQTSVETRGRLEKNPGVLRKSFTWGKYYSMVCQLTTSIAVWHLEIMTFSISRSLFWY